jgi:hypothetical protein
MRQVTRSNWECTFCGTEVWVGRDRRPVILTLAEAGRPPTRVLTVDGRIVHRCMATVVGSTS